MENLIRINAKVLLHTLNDVFINNEQRFMEKIVFWKGLLHFKETLHYFFTLWIEKSWGLSDGIEKMSHGLNGF